MSILSFPSNPTVGQEFTADNGQRYTWTGNRWQAVVGTGGQPDRLVAGNKSLVLDSNGIVTLPAGATLVTSPGSIDITAGAGGYAELLSHDNNKAIWVDDNGSYVYTNGAEWSFKQDGYIRFPGTTTSGIESASTLQKFKFTDVGPQIVAANNHTWTFGDNGNLKLPAGGDIVDSNGVTVLGGGTGGPTDRLTNGSNNLILESNGTLTLPIGRVEDTFNDGSVNIVGAEGGYVELLSFDQKSCIWAADEAYNNPANGGVGIGTNILDGAGGNQWLFGKDGKLRLPAGGGVIAGPVSPPLTITLSGGDWADASYTYTRDFSNVTTPTWTSSDTVVYIIYNATNYQWEVHHPEVDPNPVYLNGGELTFPTREWTINLPVGSIAPTGAYSYADEYNVETNKLTIPGTINAIAGNDLNIRAFNPTGGGVTINLQNRNLDTGGRNTQLEVAPEVIRLTTDFDGAQNSWTFDKTGHLVPGYDNLQDIGTPTNRIRHLYVGPGSITIGNSVLSETTSGKLVVPGLTRGTGYSVTEIEDTADQTRQFATNPVVIDYAYFSYLNGSITAPSYVAPSYYVVGLDGEGYIDRIDVSYGGSGYTDEMIGLIRSNDMLAYVGTDLDPITNWNSLDWVSIPFKARITAADTEYEFNTGGGGAGSITVGEIDSENSLTNESSGITAIGFDQGSGFIVTELDNGVMRVRLSNGGGGQVTELTNNGYAFQLGVDGTVNFDPSINGMGVLQTAADLQFNANGKTWVFDSTGAVVLPDNNAELYTPSAGDGNKNIDLYTSWWGEGSVEVYLQHGNRVSITTAQGANEWAFKADGTLSTPGGIEINGGIWSPVNSDFYWSIPSTGQWGSWNLNWGKEDLSTTLQMNHVNLLMGTTGDIPVHIAANGKLWDFGTDGILHLPSTVGDIYRDGVSVLGAGSYILPTASDTVLGGVKVGYGLTVDNDGVLSVTQTSAVTISDTAPTLDNGFLWFNSDEGRTYVRYNNQWIDANPTVLPLPVEPSRLANGDAELALDANGSIVVGKPTASASVSILGAGTGDIQGYPTLLDIVQDNSNPWAFTLRNARAGLDKGLFVYVTEEGDTEFAVADNDNNENILTFNQNGYLTLENRTQETSMIIGTVADRDNVVWANEGEYLGVWFGGNSNFTSGGSGYGPTVSVNVGYVIDDGDYTPEHQDHKPEMDLVNVNVLGANWNFRADGNITLPNGGVIGVADLTEGTGVVIATHPNRYYTFDTAYFEDGNGSVTTGNARYFECGVQVTTNGEYIITSYNPGNSWVVGHQLIIDGVDLDGNSGTHDLTITVTGVDPDQQGVITSISVTGRGVGRTILFGSDGTINNAIIDGGNASTWLHPDTAPTINSPEPLQAVKTVLVPVHSTGASGDKKGDTAFDENFMYYCTKDYTTGTDNIWVKNAWTANAW